MFCNSKEDPWLRKAENNQLKKKSTEVKQKPKEQLSLKCIKKKSIVLMDGEWTEEGSEVRWRLWAVDSQCKILCFLLHVSKSL